MYFKVTVINIIGWAGFYLPAFQILTCRKETPESAERVEGQRVKEGRGLSWWSRGAGGRAWAVCVQGRGAGGCGLSHMWGRGAREGVGLVVCGAGAPGRMWTESCASCTREGLPPTAMLQS